MKNTHVLCTDSRPGHLQRGGHRPGPGGLEIGQGVQHRRLPVEVGREPPAPVSVQQRIQPNVLLPGQVGTQNLPRERQVIPVLMPHALAPPATHRRQPTGLAGASLLPSSGIDIGSGSEQGGEELDLRLGRRLPADRAGVSFEEAGLRRAGWRRLLRRQLQQPQQPRVLRSQLRVSTRRRVNSSADWGSSSTRHTVERSRGVQPQVDRVAAMTAQTTSSTDSDTSIGELIARAADLKGELVAFAQSPRFARRLDTVLFETADRYGCLDEGNAVLAVDHFALQHRLSDGRTVLERFVAQRRPALSDDEREMLLGWSDVVEACFEVRRFDRDAVLLHNLLDDVIYRVYSNMGRTAFATLREGMFFVGRIVPLHPATDAWLVTGHYSPFPKSARRQIATAAAEQITTHPELLRRNPAMLQRAWEAQAEHRADFIDQIGADMTVLPSHDAQETLREHYRRQQQRAMAGLDAKTARRAAKTAPAGLGQLSEELLAADSIALIYDEVEGLTLYADFGRLDALFADPTLTRDRSRLAQLRSYLDDDSISPLAIRRLVQRHPDGTDPVFRALLRKPRFSWQRDGEKLLRRHKKAFLDREPTPSISIVGERLTELLRATR